MEEQSELELDERMSDETKTFVRNYFKVAKPNDIVKLDLKVVTKIKEDQAKKLSELVKLDESLKIDEIFVKNLKDNYEIPVTRYAPIKNAQGESEAKTSPITIFIHGGGHCINSRTTHHMTISRLALKTSSTWLSIGYRTCSYAKYPTPLEDCQSVVEWVADNKALIDDSSSASKIVICGDSSGGQLAAILAHQYKSKIDYQVLIYPVVNYGGIYDSYKQFTKDCYLLTPQVIEHFTKNLGVDPSLYKEQFAVIEYKDYASLPKCLIICADLDPLVDDSKHYHKKLIDTNNECELKVIQGTIHGFFSSPLAFSDAFDQAENHIQNFFNNM